MLKINIKFIYNILDDKALKHKLFIERIEESNVRGSSNSDGCKNGKNR